MFDARLRRLVAPAADAAGGWLADRGVPPLAITAAGWAVGVAACVTAGFGQFTAALVLWLANRALDGLDGPAARRRGPTTLGGFADIVADFSIYGGFVLAIAIAQPDARLACLALLVAYYVSGTAFLALSALMDQRRGDFADGRSLRFVGGIAEGAETIVAFALFCVLPQYAQAIAWVFAAAVAVTAVQRVAAGVRVLGEAAAAETPRPTRQPGAGR